MIPWRPDYRVTVDGRDISSIVAERLLRLTLTDEAGVQSDVVELSLSDHLPVARLAIPPTGAEIEVALGYQFGLRDMGLFIADSIEAGGPPDQLRIRATASIHGETNGGKTALTEQRSRSWPDGTTVGDMVSTIAGEHGLDPAVSQSLEGVPLDHVDQVDESDINLLTRIARDLDAIAKPAGGFLVFATRGESLTVTGQPMPTTILQPSQVSRWAYRASLREPAGQVVASFRDVEESADVEVTAGDGKPVRRLRRRFSSREQARRAADAEFRRSKRAGRTLSLDLPGDPDIVAEGKVQLVRFRPDVPTEWLVTRVSHLVDAQGYRSRVECELFE